MIYHILSRLFLPPGGLLPATSWRYA